jgi:hypothetical protein
LGIPKSPTLDRITNELPHPSARNRSIIFELKSPSHIQDAGYKRIGQNRASGVISNVANRLTP